LPCLGRTEIDRRAGGEQFVTVEDSMGIVSSSRGHLEPASPKLLSETAIVAGLAEATLGTRSTVDWPGLTGNYDRIREHIERAIPGFENFNSRVREGVFYLPNAMRDERRFANDLGKAGRRVVFLNPDDIAEAGFMQGQLVDLTSHFKGLERTAPRFQVGPYPIPRRCAATG